MGRSRSSAQRQRRNPLNESTDININSSELHQTSLEDGDSSRTHAEEGKEDGQIQGRRQRLIPRTSHSDQRNECLGLSVDADNLIKDIPNEQQHVSVVGKYERNRKKKAGPGHSVNDSAGKRKQHLERGAASKRERVHKTKKNKMKEEQLRGSIGKSGTAAKVNFPLSEYVPVEHWIEDRAAGPGFAGSGDNRDDGRHAVQSCPPSTAGLAVKLATFNVLSHAGSVPRFYPWTRFHWLRYSARAPLLLEQIKALDADIVCVQEVDREGRDGVPTLQDSLEKEGFSCRFICKPTNVHGCAILYRETLWRCVHYQEVFFDDCPDAEPHGNVGQVALLEYCGTQTFSTQQHANQQQCAAENSLERRMLCVANAHLYWKRDDCSSSGASIQARQLAFLLQQTLALCRKKCSEKVPLLVCGDFNSARNSDALSTVLSLHNDGSDNGCSDILKCAYDSYPDQSKLATQFKPEQFEQVDHILFSSSLRVTSLLRLPLLSEHHPIPSRSVGSDHLPLAAQFRLD